MDGCRLELRLERGDPRFRPGEVVRGVVRVEALRRALHCRRLRVGLRWETAGKGRRDAGDVGRGTVHQGELVPGEPVDAAFELRVPAGPPSHDGDLIRLGWSVAAEADLRDGASAHAATEIEVLPAPAEERGGVEAETVEPAPGDRRFLQVLGAAFVLGGALSLLDELGAWFGESGGALGSLARIPFGALFLLVGLAVLLYAHRKGVGEARLGPVAVEHGAGTFAPGEAVPLRLAFTPRRELRLAGVDLQLVCVERARFGSDADEDYREKELARQSVEAARAATLPAGRELRAEAAFVVPEGAPASWDTPHNEVDWFLRARVRLGALADWERRWPIEVAGARVSARS